MLQKPGYNVKLENQRPLISMKKIEPGKIEEVVIVVFFVLFFILTAIAETMGQTNKVHYKQQNPVKKQNIKQTNGFLS